MEAADDKKVRCNLISPERPLFEGEVDHVVFATKNGENAVFPLHAPMVALLGIGQVRLIQGGETTRFAIRGGFVQVLDNQVDLLVDTALTPDE
ncbi:MAG: F0F1 ATP synthase subunit epsilon, partial [Proteobacteria bacterium]|nr:F0F1 ATP synthase subunit epsilon [Pseudomonadota bacterium]